MNSECDDNSFDVMDGTINKKIRINTELDNPSKLPRKIYNNINEMPSDDSGSDELIYKGVSFNKGRL